MLKYCAIPLNSKIKFSQIAQPMQDYTQQPQQQQHQQQSRMDENLVFSQGRDPNGMIMVESNPHGAYKQQQQQVESAAATSNGKKKNKKKNKNKNGDDASNKSNLTQTMGGSGTDRMVSLQLSIINQKISNIS